MLWRTLVHNATHQRTNVIIGDKWGTAPIFAASQIGILAMLLTHDNSSRLPRGHLLVCWVYSCAVFVYYRLYFSILLIHESRLLCLWLHSCKLLCLIVIAEDPLTILLHYDLLILDALRHWVQEWGRYARLWWLGKRVIGLLILLVSSRTELSIDTSSWVLFLRWESNRLDGVNKIIIQLMMLLWLNNRLFKVCLLSLIRRIVNEWPCGLYSRAGKKYLLRLELIRVMNGKLIISNLFNNHHVTVAILYGLLLSHKITRLIHLLLRPHVITTKKCRLACGYNWFGRDAFEVVPSPLAFLAGCCHTYELWGLYSWLWVTLIKYLLTRFLMLLHDLTDKLMVRVLLLLLLLLLLITMKVSSGRIFV